MQKTEENTNIDNESPSVQVDSNISGSDQRMGDTQSVTDGGDTASYEGTISDTNGESILGSVEDSVISGGVDTQNEISVNDTVPNNEVSKDDGAVSAVGDVKPIEGDAEPVKDDAVTANNNAEQTKQDNTTEPIKEDINAASTKDTSVALTEDDTAAPKEDNNSTEPNDMPNKETDTMGKDDNMETNTNTTDIGQMEERNSNMNNNTLTNPEGLQTYKIQRPDGETIIQTGSFDDGPSHTQVFRQYSYTSNIEGLQHPKMPNVMSDPPTNIVHLKGFVRPLNIPKLEHLLRSFGNVKRWYLHDFRTECAAFFDDATNATSCFKELNGMRYPDDSRQPLTASFMDEFAFDSLPKSAVSDESLTSISQSNSDGNSQGSSSNSSGEQCVDKSHNTISPGNTQQQQVQQETRNSSQDDQPMSLQTGNIPMNFSNTTTPTMIGHP